MASKPELSEGRKLMVEFEQMRNMAEARALSKLSLERPLSSEEFERYKNVMEKVGVVV